MRKRLSNEGVLSSLIVSSLLSCRQRSLMLSHIGAGLARQHHCCCIMVLKRPSSYARALEQRLSTSPLDSGKSHASGKRAKLWLLCLIPAVLLLMYVAYPAQKSSTAIFVSSGGLQLLSVDQSPVSSADSPVKRVALCFFGLTRSLNHTLPSIRENLIGKLNDEGFEVDIFLHTYNDVTHLTNGRTGEDDDLDTEQWHMLEPYDHLLTSQDTFTHSVQYVPICGTLMLAYLLVAQVSS